MDTFNKYIFYFSFCILLNGVTYGQSLTGNYHAAIGLRAGDTSGLTFKFNSGGSSNIELLAGFWSNWLSLTALYEKNVPAFNVNGMNWYYGAGGHISFVTGDFYNRGRQYSRGDDFALGLDGIVGLEYKVPPIPFAVSVDIKPFMEVYRNGNFFLGIDPGLGVKFTF